MLVNDSDVDGDIVTVSNFGQPANGIVSIQPNGEFEYTPIENFNGTDSFTYEITDGNGETSTQTVTIEVAAVADEAQIEVQDAIGNEDQAIDLNIAVSLLDNEGSENISNVTIRNVPESATLSAGVDNGDGTWTLEPEQLERLQLNLTGFGNSNFELQVDVTTVDADSSTVRTVPVQVEVQNDTVQGTLAQQLLDSTQASENTESLAQPITQIDGSETTNTPEVPDDFESAYNKIQSLSQQLVDFNSDSVWNRPEFESFSSETEETQNANQIQPAEIDQIDFADANLSLDRVDLEIDDLEEFTPEELSEFVLPVNGLEDLEVGESASTANLTAAALLLLVTKREDSRQKLAKLNDKKSKQQN